MVVSHGWPVVSFGARLWETLRIKVKMSGSPWRVVSRA